MGTCFSIAVSVELPICAATTDLRGTTINDTAERALTLRQLRDVAAQIQSRCTSEKWISTNPLKNIELLRPETVTLYDLAQYFIKPETSKRKCSYVELVAVGPQPPKWFVSHWWGEPVLLFLRCLEQHAKDHELDDDTAYWICAYANNQHNVDDDVTADPSKSSFVRAIELAEGRVLSVIDQDGVTFTRIWCCLEIFLGLRGTYEVYTAKNACRAYDLTRLEDVWHDSKSLSEMMETLPIVRDRYAVGLTSGPCAADKGYGDIQTLRQADFPVELVKRAFDVQVQCGDASVQIDKVHILNYMVGRQAGELELEPLSEHLEYTKTNTELQGTFAAASWRLLLEVGEDMSLAYGALKASNLKKFVLSMRGCAEFTDERALQMVKALLQTLEEFRFEMVSSGATAAGGRAVLDGVIEQLDLARVRNLSLADCMLTGEIPCVIGKCAELENLNLMSNKLTGSIPYALGMCTRLKTLRLYDNKLTGNIPDSLGQCTELQLLNLGSNQLTGGIPTGLWQCAQLKTLWLNNNQLEGDVNATLSKCTALERLDLGGNHFYGRLPDALRQRKLNGLLEVSGGPGASDLVLL